MACMPSDWPVEFMLKLPATPPNEFMHKLPATPPSMACMPDDWPIEFVPKLPDPGSLMAAPQAKPYMRKQVIKRTKINNKQNQNVTKDNCNVKNNKEELQRVHNRAYHGAFDRARREGKGLSEAKASAREETRLASF